MPRLKPKYIRQNTKLATNIDGHSNTSSFIALHLLLPSSTFSMGTHENVYCYCHPLIQNIYGKYCPTCCSVSQPWLSWSIYLKAIQPLCCIQQIQCIITRMTKFILQI